MTAASSPTSPNHIPADRDGLPVANDPIDGRSSTADSPELLRWRADILMDEMMLGAVDAVAGEHHNGASVSDRDASDEADELLATTQPQQTGPSATDDELPDDGAAQVDAAHGDAALPASVEQTTSSAQPDDAGGRSAGEEDVWWRHPFRPEVRSESAAPPAAMPSHSAAAASLPAPLPAATDSEAANSLLRPPSAVHSADASPLVEAPAKDVSPSSGPARGAKRTNLLPRVSHVDAEALWRESDEMRREIEAVIPAQHEWGSRGRHLLDKGEGILRQTPERTAEVEYYFNQVRAILQRVRQTYAWSQLYMKRLGVYLWAWIAFAAVCASGCFLYWRGLADFFSLLTGLSADEFLVQALPFWLATMAVGALGGAAGALFNMRRYHQLEHGFFDRKYSLRGLLLPILAAIVAMVLYVPFALIAYFAPFSPTVAATLLLVATILAFVFGLFQQTLYGVGL